MSNNYKSSKKENDNGMKGTESTQNYIDTHCHLDYILQKMHLASMDEFFKKVKLPSNFEACISVYCDPAAFSPSFATYPDQLKSKYIYGAFGIHPHHAKYFNESLENRIVECLQDPKAVAWGYALSSFLLTSSEIGLDFQLNRSEPEVQKQVFAQQILKAVELSKPIVVHSRNSEKDMYEILKQYLPKEWKVHMHCFNESAEQATRLLSDFPNMYIGFTYAINFNSAQKTRDIIKNIVPLDRILLETDGLGPQKGTAAHMGLIPSIAQTIATLQSRTLDEVLKQARVNTTSVYGI